MRISSVVRVGDTVEHLRIDMRGLLAVRLGDVDKHMCEQKAHGVPREQTQR